LKQRLAGFTVILIMLLTNSAVVPLGIEAGESHIQHVDERIWTQKYWLEMARLGLVEVASDLPLKPAVYTSSRIDAPGVFIGNSPDVPVTTDAATTQSENTIFVNPLDNGAVLNSNNSTDYPFTQIYGTPGFCTADSGKSWSGDITGVDPISYCDPACAIGLNGRYYVNYVMDDWGQGCAFSTNQGSTWFHVQIAPGPWVLDKNHLWVDNSPTSPYEGNLYSAWLNYQGGANHLNIELVRSVNHGLSWSSPINISSAVAAGYYNHGPNLKTGPNGEVYAVWAIYDSSSSDENAIGFASSADGGVTFAPGVRIIENIRGVRATKTSKNMRVNSFPVMAADISSGPYRGYLYVVWPNIGIPGVNIGPDIDVYLIRSTDGGISWSDPIRVNQDPAGLGKEHFSTWITCDPETGVLAVIFYDDRNVSATGCETFVAVSRDAGATWTDFKVSDVSFTPAPIPGMSSDYFGDYIGISARGGRVYPVWTDNRAGRPLAYVSPFTIEQTPAAIADLSATLAGDAIRLSWSAVTADENGLPVTVDHYVIYRGDDPDFLPSGEDSIGVTTDTTFVDTAAAIGDPATDHYWVVKATSAPDIKSADSNRVGEIDIDLANMPPKE
jgi:hypothetical protein